MSKSTKILSTILVLSLLLAFVSCGQGNKQETTDENVENKSSQIETELSAKDFQTNDSDGFFENDFLGFEIPSGWFISDKNDNSVSIYPSNIDNVEISGISLQLIDTHGYLNSKKYTTLTSSTIMNPEMRTLSNKNGLMFFEVRGLVQGAEFENFLWQLVSDIGDENILLISIISEVPASGFNLQGLLDSIVVKK